MKKNIIAQHITINGVEYSGKVDLVLSLIDSGLLVPVVRTEEPEKATPKKKESAPKNTEAANSQKVLYTNANGLQFVKSRKYTNAHMKDYYAKCKELFGTDKPKASQREELYRALGWII